MEGPMCRKQIRRPNQLACFADSSQRCWHDEQARCHDLEGLQLQLAGQGYQHAMLQCAVHEKVETWAPWLITDPALK
jgi:hypothetical protein